MILAASLFAGCGETISRPGGSFDAGPVFTSKTRAISHTFRVVNTTGRTVKIVDEMHGCLCTSVKFEKGATLAPGSEMPLTLTVNAIAAPPDQKVECTVLTDHPTMAQWSYQLTLHPYPDAILKPARIDLGGISSSDPTESKSPREPAAYLELYGETAGRSPPESDPALLNGVRVRIGEPSGRAMLAGRVALARYPIFVEPPTSSEDGRHQATLNFRSGGLPLLSTSICWQKLGPLSAVPAQLSFGVVEPGRSTEPLQISITARGGREFRITGIETSSREVTAKPLDASTSARSHRLAASFQAGAATRDRAVTGHLIIKTDLDGGAAVKVPYSAFLLPPVREAMKDSSIQTSTREEER